MNKIKSDSKYQNTVAVVCFVLFLFDFFSPRSLLIFYWYFGLKSLVLYYSACCVGKWFFFLEFLGL